MGRGRRLLLLVAAGGLLAGAIVGGAAAANAKLLAAPRAHAANFPQSTTVSVPAGGDAMVTSSALPPQTKQATVDLEPVTSGAALQGLATVLATLPTRGKRVLTCVLLYAALPDIAQFIEDADFADPVLGLLLLHACVQMALSIGAGQATGALASLASACARADRSVSLKLTHTASGYHAHLHGKTRRPSGHSPLVTSCRRSTTGGLVLTIRPRSHRATLPSVVGPNLGVGLVSPSTSKTAVAVRTTFSVS